MQREQQLNKEKEMFKNESMQIFIDFNMITSPICVSSQTQMQCHYEDKTNKKQHRISNQMEEDTTHERTKKKQQRKKTNKRKAKTARTDK